MSTPIKNNQTPPPPATDPYSKNYGTGGETDPYGTGGGYDSGYDPGMGGDSYGDYGAGDEFIGDEQPVEGEGGPTAPSGGYTLQDLRSMLADSKGSLTDEQYASLNGRINRAAGLSPEAQATELSKIAADLDAIVNPAAAGAEGMGEDGAPANTEDMKKAADDFKRELENYRNDVEGMENLTEEEKTQFLGQIDKMINDIELAEKDPERLAELDLESMKGELHDLQSGEEGVDAANQHPQSVKSLAEAAGLTPEELAAKAESKGIDLSNVPIPPSIEILDFLKEISPELKAKFEAIETAVSDRRKFYDDSLRAANKQNDDNEHNDTSSPDNQDMSNWQNLLDLRYFQDEKSKAVKDAMREARDALLPLLTSLYPGQEVKIVETSGKSGWEKDQQDFLNADKITIGGTQIDLFSAADGKPHSSTTADQPDPIDIPAIHYDGSGDGAWKPAKSWFNLYGESTLSTEVSDEAETYKGNTLD